MTSILLVPGFMQRGDAWEPLLEQLPAELDARPLDHARHDFEGRLAEIAAAGEGAVLCGYSLGGRLALRAALRDPGRYRGVVTIGASAGIEEPVARSARAEADERLAGWMETMPIAEIVSVWERQPLFADQCDALVEAQRAGPAEPRPARARPAAPHARARGRSTRSGSSSRRCGRRSWRSRAPATSPTRAPPSGWPPLRPRAASRSSSTPATRRTSSGRRTWRGSWPSSPR